MSAPGVSVIIPAYKAERHLPETLACIRQQTYTDWELLICEDGAFDRTPEIVAAFAAQVPQRVQLLRHPRNLGVSRTRNALIDAAAGTYLAFVDADDLWPVNYLDTALRRLQESGADWTVTGAAFIDEQGRDLGRTMIPPVVTPDQIPNALLRQSFILPSAVVAHRNVFATGLRFDSAYPIGEDLDLWIRLIEAGFKPLLVHEAGIRYRKHPTSATADMVRFPEEFSRVFERHLSNPLVDTRHCRQAISSMLLNVARMTWKRDPARALRALQRLFRIDRWNPKGRVFYTLARFRLFTSSQPS